MLNKAYWYIGLTRSYGLLDFWDLPKADWSSSLKRSLIISEKSILLEVEIFKNESTIQFLISILKNNDMIGHRGSHLTILSNLYNKLHSSKSVDT